MKPLTTGQLAARLGVSRETVRNYTRDYSEFLSEDAAGAAPNAKRRYSERDALILATIADRRSSGLDGRQIKQAIREGKLLDKLPEVPTPEEQEARRRVSLVPVADLHRALDHIRTLQEERDRLVEERDRAIQTWQTDVTAYTTRIADLERQIGTLEGRLTQMETDRLPPARLMQIILLVAAFAVVVIVAIVLTTRPAG